MKSLNVEDYYLQFLSDLPGAERVLRSCALLNFTAEMIAHQIKSDTPTLTERQLKIEVAKRFYGSEPAILRLLEDID